MAESSYLIAKKDNSLQMVERQWSKKGRGEAEETVMFAYEPSRHACACTCGRLHFR